MSVPTPEEAQGFFALAFFLVLIIFVCFEAVQVARGKIHLAGIFRAALEILILSPVIVLLIVLVNKVSDKYDLDWSEQSWLVKLVVIPALAVIWAPWTHYRASQITKSRNRVRKTAELDAFKR